MSGAPEPPLWETSGLWALVYGAIAIAVLVYATRGRGDESRRRVVGRLVSIATVLLLVAHLGLAWGALSRLAGIPSVLGKRDAQSVSKILIDAVMTSAAVLTCFVLTILVASGFRRPRRPGRRWAIPREWPAAAGVLVAAAFIEGRRLDAAGVHPALPAPWVERVGIAVGLLAVVALPVLLLVAVSLVLSRGPEKAARRESLRGELTLWGFLLFAGTLILLEGRTVSLLEEVRFLGPRAPGGGTLFEVWFHTNRVILLFAFAGFAALCFGGLHLGRREKAR